MSTDAPAADVTADALGPYVVAASHIHVRSRTCATCHERVAMRREVVLAVVRRRLGLTAREISDDLRDDGHCYSGCLFPYSDLKVLQARGLVEAVHFTRRTIMWVAPRERDPLLWEGDDG